MLSTIKYKLAFKLPTIEIASGTDGCKPYSERRGSKDETYVDLSC